MGAWGIGLYSSDFAQDLRSSVRAVARLPFEPERLLDYLCETEPAAANDPKDPDYTIFWLTVADQLATGGIACPRARDRAVAIIVDGTDLSAMAALGMDEKSLAKRRAMLETLRSQLMAPLVTGKARSVLKAPQKLILELGEVFTYPICKGDTINPYAVGKDWDWVKAWKRDGWGAFVVAERGLVFGFLAWYRPLVITEPLSEEADLAVLSGPRMWLLRNPGTLSARHLKNMQLKSIGRVSVDLAKLDRLFPKRMSPVSAAVGDISLANNIDVRPLSPHEAHRVKHGYPPTPRISALSEVA